MSIPAALARRRNYAGPALFSYGFRPFFLGAAVWSAAAVLLWIPQYFGDLTLPIAVSPLDWHVHEMVWGYVAATIAGFLLTAIPNWTGRLPVCGAPLVGLAFLWAAGRLAMLLSGEIGLVPAAVIDVAFLGVLLTVCLREIVAGRNWRNLRVLVVLALIIAANVVWHVEILLFGAADYGNRLGVAAVIGLVTLIGGRIIPSFTHNWLVRSNPGRLPISFGRFDALCLGVGGVALAAWAIVPTQAAAGMLLLVAGGLHAWRLARWAGDRTFADRLVLVLHAAYLFVPIGFLLVGASVLWPAQVPLGAGIHAWTTGAIGLMTLAVMTRATLGHTGRALAASPVTQAIYACLIVAALARIAAAFGASIALLHLAAFAWLAAFGGFAVVYGPLLLRRPPNWAQGR
ncbi:MAG TPA: NnrS family protein [Xanthobacteraceae bacterium]|nr:NnrS family protein [Xanthobacteraceae bacterium]